MQESPVACHCEVPLANGVRRVHTVLLVDELEVGQTEHSEVPITAHRENGRVAWGGGGGGWTSHVTVWIHMVIICKLYVAAGNFLIIN